MIKYQAKGGKNMAVSKNKTGVLINMDKTLKIKLEELAKKDNRTLTGYIINVLMLHVERESKYDE